MKRNQKRLRGQAIHSIIPTQSARPHTALWISVAAGLAALAWISTRSPVQRTRRFADHEQERRNPLHFFLAGPDFKRRNIDRSGARPLFERRKSAYDAY
ncbi:MAG TPA: hypothetical protein VJ603_07425 [Paucimonas sp.]|nr:hypothetical protein [Paucimonas sp.]HJW57000.1 hypothetical protein [Burkholderiaceae bacterium]